MEICFKNYLLEAHIGGFESRGLLAWQSGWVVQEVVLTQAVGLKLTSQEVMELRLS